MRNLYGAGECASQTRAPTLIGVNIRIVKWIKRPISHIAASQDTYCRILTCSIGVKSWLVDAGAARIWGETYGGEGIAARKWRRRGSLKSGRTDSNRRHSAWEADVLPLNYTRRQGNHRPWRESYAKAERAQTSVRRHYPSMMLPSASRTWMTRSGSRSHCTSRSISSSVMRLAKSSGMASS